MKLKVQPYDDLWALPKLDFDPGESLIFAICPRDSDRWVVLEAIRDFHTGYLVYKEHDLVALCKIAR